MSVKYRLIKDKKSGKWFCVAGPGFDKKKHAKGAIEQVELLDGKIRIVKVGSREAREFIIPGQG